MTKIHTRIKRKFSLTPSFGHHQFFRGESSKNGVRTFSTKELAEAYQKEHKLQGSIVAAKKNKRWKIE